MVEEKKETTEKKEPTEEAKIIKPILVVPGIDKEKHAVLEVTSKADEELLKLALANPQGVVVKCSAEGDEKVCPAEPNKPYAESICAVLEKKIGEALKKSVFKPE